MISGKLVYLIESHWNEITSRIIEQVRREPNLERVRAVIEPDMREYGQRLLQNLGHWLAAGNEEDLARQYEELGKLRYQQDVPLEESVRGLFLIREKMLDYVEEHIFTRDTLALHAEEELDRRLGRFFDLLTIHLVRGYERALRRSVTASA